MDSSSLPRHPDWTALRRRVMRHRRPLAAALAGLAVLCLVPVLAPASPPLQDVVVAAGDVPGGAVLDRTDVEVRSFPVPFAPPGAFTSVDDVVGRMTGSALDTGEAVTATRLVSPALTAGAVSADGSSYAVPVRLEDREVAGLLEAGVRIDIIRSRRAGGQAVLAEGVRVITVPRSAPDGAFGGPRVAGTLVLVEADRATAVRLASSGNEDLYAILR
ncbi:MAG: SAF domain-containing protein [bacterium]